MISPSSHTLPDRFTPSIMDDRARRAVRARGDRAALARATSGRCRLVDPTTCERDYTALEQEFMNSMQAYKASSGRMFPTWSEVLEVLVGLGYEKVSNKRTVVL